MNRERVLRAPGVGNPLPKGSFLQAARAFSPLRCDSKSPNGPMMKLAVQGGLAPQHHGGGICSRCLFQNECLRIRLIGLSGGKDLAGCFAGCRGVLTVSFGEVQVEVGGTSRTLQEGESLPLPARGDSFHLWTRERADVVLFESLGKEKAN